MSRPCCIVRRSRTLLISVVYTVSVVAITVRLDHGGGAGASLDVLAYVCMIGVGVALAFRRRWPTGTLYAILALTLVYVVRDYTGGPFFLAVFIAIGTVASVMPTRAGPPTGRHERSWPWPSAGSSWTAPTSRAGSTCST